MAQRQIIIRRARARDTHIQNRIIWDGNISQMARFSLIAMLSLPDSWDYSVRGMAAMLKVSKDTMGKYISELEKSGYLKRKQGKCEAGRFSSTQYILTDTPGDFGGEEPCPNFSDTEDETALPCPNLPDTELPDPEKSPQKKRPEQWSTTEQLPPKAPQGAAGSKRPKRGRAAKEAPDWKPERFEGFWRMYPLKKSKQAAIRAWDSLCPDDRLLAMMGHALQRQMNSPEWQRKLSEEGGQGIPYPATWLNNRRWEDEDRAVPSAAPAPRPRKFHMEIREGEEVAVYDE